MMRAATFSLFVLACIHLGYILGPTMLLPTRYCELFLASSMLLSLYAHRFFFSNTDWQIYCIFLLVRCCSPHSYPVSQVLYGLTWIWKLYQLATFQPPQRVAQLGWRRVLAEFSGPQLWVNAATYLSVSTTKVPQCRRKYSVGQLELKRPTFRSRLAALPAPIVVPAVDWIYCWYNTPLVNTLKFLTMATCPRTMNDATQQQPWGPFRGTIYSVQKNDAESEEIVETIHNMFSPRELYPNMRAYYDSANDNALPHTIQYLRLEKEKWVVHEGVTKTNPNYTEHLQALERARFLHDFAGVHLIVHIWFEDYLVCADHCLHPDDVLLRKHFVNMGSTSGYHASLGPLSFDHDYNGVGRYFRIPESSSYLEEFDLSKTRHLNANVLEHMKVNITYNAPTIESCHVTQLYGEAFQMFATDLLKDCQSQLPSDKGDHIAEGRSNMIAEINERHNTEISTMEDLLVNHLLLVLQHSLVHEGAVSRMGSVDQGNYQTAFHPDNGYHYTLESVLGNKLHHRSALVKTFLPPSKMEYGIQW
ncbi:expressed unknown protein [Seminavis robusta]|uniref:Uncharacterized protein n=1 Tax=Seminavis robusta TaxID=568900 RepID=A0A9N8DDP6_9STRA|nr:expressed unknown protein [Seminavis robusta]|eukprot:Sro91_g047700.1 n/a (532) ;mRNA; f:58437-60032